MIRLLIIVSLAISSQAHAEEVAKFSPFPTVVTKGDSTYIGILLSEEEFRKILQKRIDSTATLGTCSVDRRVCLRQREIYTAQIKSLEAEMLRNDSWFSRNRGALGMMTGLLIGAGMSVAIVHGVYQK
jgi:hypothetical protein|tara:strand:- start:1949 stop:2332 length:384 start_codon:yes stop_codon:yes gene_type:complete